MKCFALSDGMQASNKVSEFSLGKKIGQRSEEWKSKTSPFEKRALARKMAVLFSNSAVI